MFPHEILLWAKAQAVKTEFVFCIVDDLQVTVFNAV